LNAVMHIGFPVTLEMSRVARSTGSGTLTP